MTAEQAMITQVGIRAHLAPALAPLVLGSISVDDDGATLALSTPTGEVADLFADDVGTPDTGWPLSVRCDWHTLTHASLVLGAVLEQHGTQAWERLVLAK